MIAPVGMPTPEMGCPTIRPDTPPPAETCTFVSRVLPDVAVALNMMGQTKFCAVVIVTAVPAAVAFDDIVTVVVPTAVMTVLAGMPVPRRACPTANPATLDTAVSTLLAEVVVPLKEAAVIVAVAFCDIVTTVAVALTVSTEVMVVVAFADIATYVDSAVTVSADVMVAVAFADIVTVVVPTTVMTVLAGMPVPVRACPAANPVVLDTLVSTLLPAAVMAVNVNATGVGNDVMVVGGLAGMPVPVMVCPTTNSARLDTLESTLLPEVVRALNETASGNAAMVVPVGMPAPATGCPTTIPEVLDTPVSKLLPEVVRAVNMVPAEL